MARPRTEAGAAARARALDAPTVLVLASWIFATAAAVWFVARHASPIPWMDDMAVVSQVTGETPITLRWLWAPHNEHRLPLPKLLLVALASLCGGDLRAAMFFEVLLLSLVALACILAARSIRGRTSAVDLFFPVLWLHWGDCENLLVAFQVALTLPTALGALALALVARAKEPGPRTLGLIGACVLLLPLSGGAGVAQAPALAAWTIFVALAWVRSSERARRRAAFAAFACTALALATTIAYTIGIPPREIAVAPDLATRVGTAARVATLALGPAAIEWWPSSLVVVGALVLSAAALLARALTRGEGERVRATGLAACLVSTLGVIAAIGWARSFQGEQVGFVLRYVTLPAPLLAVVFFAWTLYGGAASARVVPLALCALALALLPANTRIGLRDGAERRRHSDDLVQDVRAGLSSTELSARHFQWFFRSCRPFAAMLASLRERHMAPFAEGTWPADIDAQRIGPFEMLSAQPLRGAPSGLIKADLVGRRAVLLAPPDSELEFAVPPGARALRGALGIEPRGYARGPNDGVRFRVELDDGERAPVLLFERLVEPLRRREDRGFLELCVDLPAGARGTLVLRTLNDPGSDRRGDLAFWTELAFDGAAPP